MKKLKLKALSLGAREILSRDQMKQIGGGEGSGSGTEISCSYECVSNCEGQEHRIWVSGRTTLSSSAFCSNASSLCTGLSGCEVYADNCSCS